MRRTRGTLEPAGSETLASGVTSPSTETVHRQIGTWPCPRAFVSLKGYISSKRGHLAYSQSFVLVQELRNQDLYTALQNFSGDISTMPRRTDTLPIISNILLVGRSSKNSLSSLHTLFTFVETSLGEWYDLFLPYVSEDVRVLFDQE